ncbi:alpha/beta hydrolase [Burkholderia stagnalis]|uniref:alpha/beta hydrolase family protein n=1 Tax=Burkholderia stagnalis TaxID=1503054 RepID=UPI00075F7BDC|nr:alpha/beta fold hydrolase [Burkholderia stagnalis]KWK50779.1 alpha/beta hydrolase [Burkholderia stagnalis]KWK51911.1 alpha/beta hydrolase [Burkholderia stagnalis]KWN66891.1 alpha/beta hydrolase [Burkholderia stagnalis]
MSEKDARMPEPEPFAVTAADGYPIKGFVWRHRAGAADDEPRPVVIVNAATSVRCRYYFRFAGYLHRHGYDAIVYDYRGIGESRPARLDRLDATWLDWGERDFEAVLRYALAEFPGQPIDVVAHSIGGFVAGLAPSNHLVRRVFTMGAQYAHWRDYAPRSRLAMLWKWHIVMPVLSALFGYFPAKRLGWMEDTPKGVALSWSRSRPDFEDTYRRAPIERDDSQRRSLVRRFTAMRAPVLAASVTDDPFGTIPAIERLLRYFTRSRVVHLRIGPDAIGVDSIGHFAFFHSRFESTLWPIPLGWLKTGQLAPKTPGWIVSERDARGHADTEPVVEHQIVLL